MKFKLLEDVDNDELKRLRFELWANLQDIQRLKDIEDRSKDEEHKKEIRKHISDLEDDVYLIRQKIKFLKGEYI